MDQDVETRDVVAAFAVRAGQHEQTGQADRAETLRREARVRQAVLDG